LAVAQPDGSAAIEINVDVLDTATLLAALTAPAAVSI
jgi:hypothetical protein